MRNIIAIDKSSIIRDTYLTFLETLLDMNDTMNLDADMEFMKAFA